MNILIIDDEITVLKRMTEIIRERYDFPITAISSSEEFNNSNIDTDSINLAFIDIQLRNESGIVLGEFLHQKNPDMQFVYISGYLDKVTDVFLSVPALGFIDKPIRKEKVFSYIDKVINNNEDNVVSFCSHGQNVYFNPDSILYIESRKKEVIFHLANGESSITAKLDEIEKIVGQQFVRCHKSYLVNLKYISCVKSAKFRLLNNEMVNISRSCKESAIKRYYRYKGGIRQ